MHRVLVVDDSAFMRKLVSDIVTGTGEFVVAGTASSGEDALRKVVELDPDIVTLDIEMPGIDGLETLRRIMSLHPRPVVMLSARGSDDGALATLAALELGAVEFVAKPSGPISLDLSRVRGELREALRAASSVRVGGPFGSPGARTALPAANQLNATRARGVPSNAGRRLPADAVVCIASSTGGPAALTRVVPGLRAMPGVAFVIVQHMPEGFTASLAQRLDQLGVMRVLEVSDGMPVESGVVYVAKGGWHATIVRTAKGDLFRLSDEAPLWGVRPAADPLFESAAALFGERCLGVVLTGMGRDSANGLRAIRKAGGLGIVQDRESCVVPGMPVAALELAGADRIATLSGMAVSIGELLGSHLSQGKIS